MAAERNGPGPEEAPAPAETTERVPAAEPALAEDSPAPASAPPATATAPDPAPAADVRSAGAVLREGVRANWRWGLAVVGFGALVTSMGWFYLREEAPAPAASRLDSGSAVTSDLMEPTSPAYREAIEGDDVERKADAVAGGESFMPTFQSQGGRGAEPMVAEPLQPSAAAPSAPAAGVAATEPARAAVTAPAEETDPMLEQTLPQPEPRGTALVRSDAQTSEGVALGAMFGELLERWNAPPEMQVIRYDVALARADADAGAAAAAERAPGTRAEDTGAAAPGPVLVPAGRMLYASTRVGVDSELGVPVLVELHENPLRGALLTGEFQQVRDRMVVRFTRLSDPRRGLAVGVNAYAVGLDSEVGAVEGAVTRHWFSRVLLPAALGFAEEYLRAAGEPDTRVLVDGEVVTEQSERGGSERIARGLAGAMGQAGRVALEGAPARATVRIPRGSELAVVFVDPVRADGGAG